MPVSTTVMVSDETWRRLDEMKDRGDSFDDVIQDLLSGHETAETEETDGGND